MSDPITGLLTNPLAQLGLTIASSLEQQGASDSQKQASQEQLDLIRNLFENRIMGAGQGQDLSRGQNANRLDLLRNNKELQDLIKQQNKNSRSVFNQQSNKLQKQTAGRLNSVLENAMQNQGGVMDLFRGAGSRFDAESNEAVRSAIQGRDDTLADIGQMGGQEAKDIDRRFNDQRGGLAASLNSRGLTGSTILGDQEAELERRRSDSHGGLNSRLAGLRANARDSGTRNILAAQGNRASGLLNADTNLASAGERTGSALDSLRLGRANTLSGLQGQMMNQSQALRERNQGRHAATLDRNNTGLQGFDQQALQNMINFNTAGLQGLAGVEERVTHAPPSPGMFNSILNFSSQAAANAAAEPEEPSFTDQLLGGAAGMAGVGGVDFGLGAMGMLLSDVNSKRSVEPVNHDHFLEKVKELPVQSWEYKQDEGVRHVGPMAQDFMAAFGLGKDSRKIEVVDALGVAFSAIKSLADKVEALESQATEASATEAKPKRGPGRPKKQGG